MNEEIILSIIIPVYNGSKTLERCLDSILPQLEDKTEIILVDDGSKDDSGIICDNYSNKDERIVVCHKHNGGVSSARNVGIEKSRGAWIMFVDSDDTLVSGTMQSLYSDIRLETSDLFIYNLQLLKENNIMPKNNSNIINSSKQQALELIKSTLGYRLDSGPVAKLYKRDIIADLKFKENIRIGEDLLFNIEYYSRIKNKIKISPIIMYNYIINENSAMQSSRKISCDYKKLTSEVFDVINLIGVKESCVQECISFELTNYLQGLFRDREYVLEDDYHIIINSKHLVKTMIPSFFNTFLRISCLSRRMGNFYLWCLYIKNQIRQIIV